MTATWKPIPEGGRPMLERDIEEERAITYGIANRPCDCAVSADAAAQLAHFAEERAAAEDVVHDPDNRDFRREVLEELADGRNYVIWWLQRCRRQGDHDTGYRLELALLAIAAAYETIPSETT